MSVFGIFLQDSMNEERTNTVSVRELIEPLKRHWRIVAIAFLSVVLTAGFFTMTAVPQYESVGTLIFRKSGDLTSQMFDIPSVLMQKYLVKNQIGVLRSRYLATNIIQELKQSPYADSLRILGYSSAKQKQNWLQKLLHKPEATAYKLSINEAVDIFLDASKVNYSDDTDIIELRIKSSSAWEAAYLVDTWMLVYKEIDRITSRGEYTESRQFLEDKLNEMSQKLTDSENALSHYQKEKKVVSLSQETEQIVKQLTNFESLYNQAITELEAINNQIRYLKGQLDENRSTLVDDMVKITSPVLEELQREMGSLMAEKAAYQAQLLGAGYRVSNDPRLKQIDNRINGIKERIVEETRKLVSDDNLSINPLDRSENLITEILKHQTTQQSLRAKARSLKAIVDQYSAKLSSLPEKNVDLARLERDVQLNSKLYMMVREKYEEARIKESGQHGTIRIVDRAQIPDYPVSPNKVMNMVLALIFGILLGIGLAFSRDFFEDSIRSVTDIENMDIRVIGNIVFFKHQRRASFFKKCKNETTVCRAKEIFPNLLTHRGGTSAAEEDYQAVCTSMNHIINQQKTKTILFTSPGPHEGKSTTTANIAITMARKGKKILLVDADLRRPVQDLLFTGSHRRIGLTNKLGEASGWRKAIRETSVKGLDLLPAGPAVKNAPDLLSSNAMARFIENMQKAYDIIFLDSPPVLPVTDASILATIVDGIIIVVCAGKTVKDAVSRSIDSIKAVDGNLLGIILTGGRETEMYGYRSYYRSQSRKKSSKNPK